MLIGIGSEHLTHPRHTRGPCVQKTPHCQHLYVKRGWMQGMRTCKRLTKIPCSSGTGVPLGAF